MNEEFRHNEDAAAFELWVDGVRAGYVDYTLTDGVASLDHTIVAPDFSGRGLAATIVAYAVDEARAAGWKVHPGCSYARKWLSKHPEHHDLVA